MTNLELNKRQRWIFGIGAILATGISIYYIGRGVKKRVVRKRIYEKLDDLKTAEGLGATLGENEIHKANLGFDPNFWKEGTNNVVPNPNLLLPPRIARERATKIYDSIGYFSDDEGAILNEIKKVKSQGQLSQITDAYGSGALNYGNMGDDIENALKGGWFSKDRLKELNNFINTLPY